MRTTEMMLDLLMAALAVWGTADAIWLAISPAHWARVWGGALGGLGGRPRLARLLAVVELACCVWLAWRFGATAVKRRSS
ncbi:MAG: hypothetical protein IT307_19675 [Chloroflexi bacterium]|nr:hypothetical protein [Chloroflexota bacterium]